MAFRSYLIGKSSLSENISKEKGIMKIEEHS